MLITHDLEALSGGGSISESADLGSGHEYHGTWTTKTLDDDYSLIIVGSSRGSLVSIKYDGNDISFDTFPLHTDYVLTCLGNFKSGKTISYTWTGSSGEYYCNFIGVK